MEMQENNKYSKLLLKEQRLEQECLRMEGEIKKISQIDEYIIREMVGLFALWKYKSRKISKINKLKSIKRELNELRNLTDSGNFRYVVYSLCKEKGLDTEKLAQEIGFEEKKITNLLREGTASEQLIDAICSYFKIKKTEKIMRYAH